MGGSLFAFFFALTLVSCFAQPIEEQPETPSVPDGQTEGENSSLADVWVYVKEVNPKGNVTNITYDENGNCIGMLGMNGNAESRYTWVWERISVPGAWANRIKQPSFGPTLP